MYGEQKTGFFGQSIPQDSVSLKKWIVSSDSKWENVIYINTIFDGRMTPADKKAKKKYIYFVLVPSNYQGEFVIFTILTKLVEISQLIWQTWVLCLPLEVLRITGLQNSHRIIYLGCIANLKVVKYIQP